MSTPAVTSGWPGGETVTILTQAVTGQDGLGNDVYGTVASVQVPAIVAPLSETASQLTPRAVTASLAESQKGQWLIASGYTVFLPPGTVIGVTDEVIVRGETFQVAEFPASFQSPFTGVAGPIQVHVLRITG